MKRVLIVGGSGQVGAELFQLLEAENSKGSILRSSREQREGYLKLDPTEFDNPADAARILDAIGPDCILFAGGMTHVDGCEAQPELAFRANAHGPSVLASYARAHGARFVYYSTDYVFDGSAEHPGPYAEEALTNPLSVYGQSKLQGERAILRVHPEALVIRTSWVYGPDAAGKNFVSTLLRHLREGKPFRVPSDQVSTPTFNRDLARATAALLEVHAKGIVHVTGPELMSREELARAVAAFFALEDSLVEGAPTRSLRQTAARPLHSGLGSNRLASDVPTLRLSTLHEALRETESALGK